MTYVKFERLLLKNHQQFTERWVQDRIAEDPALFDGHDRTHDGVWGAMERKVRLATAVSGVSERPELAPSDRFRYGERVASQQVDVLVAER